MYDVALTVRACLEARTRVVVAWPVAARDLIAPVDQALALTPGGGRVGTLLQGALDHDLVAEAVHEGGRVVELEVGEVEALIAGLPGPGSVSCLVVPAADLPEGLWDRLVDRQPVCLVCRTDGSRVVGAELLEDPVAASWDDAGTGEELARLWRSGHTGTVLGPTHVVTVLRPVPRLVIAGDGPIAEAVARAAALLGWRVTMTSQPGEAVAEVTALSAYDNLVVVGHDDRLTGAALEAALAGPVGYIGSIGPERLQASRADWLVRRGADGLERIHAPAGLAIGARTPAEIALAVMAEALAVRA